MEKDTINEIINASKDLHFYFLKNANQVINRDELMMVVWGYNSDVNTRTLDMHIVRLRKKIESNPDRPHFMQTVRGVGYKFVIE